MAEVTYFVKKRKLRALNTLENQKSYFVTIFCHLTHNSEWKCNVFWKIVKITVYSFLKPL